MTTQTDSTPCLIHSHSPLYSTVGLYPALATSVNAVSVAWPSVNLAFYIPLRVPVTYNVQRVYWVNGAAVSGNVDLAIYDVNFTQLAHVGSTAQAGTNASQYATLSLSLTPGAYYLGLAMDNGTGAIFMGSNLAAATLRLAGILQQAAAFPLPASPTPASPSFNVWPLAGITRTSSGF